MTAVPGSAACHEILALKLSVCISALGSAPVGGEWPLLKSAFGALIQGSKVDGNLSELALKILVISIKLELVERPCDICSNRLLPRGLVFEEGLHLD